MSTIHISTGNGEPSQYDEEQVRAMLQQGVLRDDAIFWKEGMSDWQPIRNLFPQATAAELEPPPLPSHQAIQIQPLKNAGLAAALSFIVPGLGQIYNGQVTMGIVMFILTILLYYVMIILGFPIHMWLVYDAYSYANKQNNKKII